MLFAMLFACCLFSPHGQLRPFSLNCLCPWPRTGVATARVALAYQKTTSSTVLSRINFKFLSTALIIKGGPGKHTRISEIKKKKPKPHTLALSRSWSSQHAHPDPHPGPASHNNPSPPNPRTHPRTPPRGGIEHPEHVDWPIGKNPEPIRFTGGRSPCCWCRRRASRPPRLRWRIPLRVARTESASGRRPSRRPDPDTCICPPAPPGSRTTARRPWRCTRRPPADRSRTGARDRRPRSSCSAGTPGGGASRRSRRTRSRPVAATRTGGGCASPPRSARPRCSFRRAAGRGRCTRVPP